MPIKSLRKMSVIVAMDLDNGIGKNGTIPWYLKKDFAFFVEQTTKVRNPEKRNVVIMGRKCWESIPLKFRPLKNRFNVVISRTLPEQRDENLVITSDFDKILEEISFGPDADKYETIWNIGGREIYNLALKDDLAERLVVTQIRSKNECKHDKEMLKSWDKMHSHLQQIVIRRKAFKPFDADVKMPPINWNLFEEDKSKASDVFKEHDLSFSFHVYDRIRG